MKLIFTSILIFITKLRALTRKEMLLKNIFFQWPLPSGGDHGSLKIPFLYEMWSAMASWERYWSSVSSIIEFAVVLLEYIPPKSREYRLPYYLKNNCGRKKERKKEMSYAFPGDICAIVTTIGSFIFWTRFADSTFHADNS